MLQNTIALSSGFAGEVVILYRLVTTTKKFWVNDLWSFFIADSLVPLIGAMLNVALLLLESAENKRMQIIQNVQRYKYILILAIISLYIIFLLFRLVFQKVIVWQLIEVFYVFVVTVSFALGAQQMSKKLSFGISYGSDKAEQLRNHAQRDAIQRIICTAASISFVVCFGIVFEAGQLVSAQKRSPVFAFLSNFGIRVTFLTAKTILLQHLKGKSWKFGMESCIRIENKFAVERKKIILRFQTVGKMQVVPLKNEGSAVQV